MDGRGGEESKVEHNTIGSDALEQRISVQSKDEEYGLAAVMHSNW